MRSKPYAALLVVIVLFGAAVRLFDLSSVPTELIYDEVDLYNSARAIATTGHDLDGRLLPFTYSRITRNPPVYAIAGYASSLVFGKTPFGLRFPAALFGIACILLMWGIGWRLTSRPDVAILAAALQATQPIFIQFSRTAWEPSSELPFLLGGLYLLLGEFRRRRDGETSAIAFWPLAAGALLLAITSYTYLAGWFYALLLGGALVLFNVRYLQTRRERVYGVAALLVWLVASTPALWMIFFDPLTASRRTGIETFASGISASTIGTFLHDYASHFSAAYLIVNGAPIPGLTWRYLDGFGAFLWFVPLLALVGIPAAFRIVRGKGLAWWLLFWLAIYPLGGSLTNEGAPNAARTLAGAPVFCLLAAIGLAAIAQRRAIVYAASAVVATVTFGIFSWTYFVRYPHFNSNAWDSGTRATFEDILALAPRYQRVCISIRPAWYAIDSYVKFYLAGAPIGAIERIDDPSCSFPRTIIAVDSNHPLARPDFRLAAKTYDVDGSPFALLYVKD